MVERGGLLWNPGRNMELGGKKTEMNRHLVNLPGLEGKVEAALVWQANGPELALWREEQDSWVPLTLTLERGKGEMGNLQVSLGDLFSFP